MRRAAHLALAAVLFLSAIVNAFRLWVLEVQLFPGDDFRMYYSMARVGLIYGWSRIYDLELQCLPITPLAETTSHCPSLNPPPLVLLTVPLAGLPYPTAYAVWVALLLVAVVGVLALFWSRLPPPRLLYAAGALSLFPIAYCLFLGQVTIIALLGLALAWRLIAAGHPGWAGAALTLCYVKPQVVFLVPLALIVAGFWRPVLVWATAGAALALASLVMLGRHGVEAYLQLSHVALGDELNHVYTVAGIFGQNAAVAAVQIGLGLAALLAAWRLRGNLDAAIVAGILGSVLASPYWHLQDYTLLALAAVAQLSLGPRLPALLAAVSLYVVGSPIVQGVTYVPGLIQVASWQVLGIIWLGWLVVYAVRLRPPSESRELVQESPRTDLAAT